MIVVDDYFQDQELLTSFAASDEFQAGASRWWAGWQSSPARTLRQQLIAEIFGPRCPFQKMDQLVEQAAGFEHWVGQFSGDSEQNYQLNAHRDESYFKQTGQDKYPLIGAIYYPVQHEITGGYLQIYNADNEDGPFELIQPRFNRLVIFDVSILHCITR